MKWRVRINRFKIKIEIKNWNRWIEKIENMPEKSLLKMSLEFSQYFSYLKEFNENYFLLKFKMTLGIRNFLTNPKTSEFSPYRVLHWQKTPVTEVDFWKVWCWQHVNSKRKIWKRFSQLSAWFGVYCRKGWHVIKID